MKQNLLEKLVNNVNTIRRHLAQSADQLYAIAEKKLTSRYDADDFDGDARFALITVNYSTCYYLKLMLITLCQQDNLDKLNRILIVDNNSKDGSLPFLQNLEKKIGKVHVLQNTFFCHHARGLRLGIKALSTIEKHEKLKSTLILACDTDIIFRNTKTLTELASVFENKKASFAGELRYSQSVCPQAQASFLCFTRESYAQKTTSPLVYHGSPAFWMQRSLWKKGAYLHDFPSNFGGYILHRGRSGVAAAGKYNPLSSFATVTNAQAHYMGVENGESLWQDCEKKYSHLLTKEKENELIDYLHSFLT